MFPKRAIRRQLFVDAKIQGALMLRVILYWATCLVTITLMLLCWRILTGPARTFYQHLDEMWFSFGPALLGSLILLPLVIVDVVRLSNRLVGPFVRLRHGMRALARGEHVESIRFRQGDFWREFTDEFNAVVARTESQNPPRSQHDLLG
jgi:hypothetical protein